MDDYSLRWEHDALVALDQREVPARVRELRITTVDQLVDAVRNLAIRGAPAIGLAGAFGVAISARTHTVAGAVDTERVAADAELIATARPTAVNLEWGVRRAMSRLSEGPAAILDEAKAMLVEDGERNRVAAEQAADVLQALGPDRPLRILTHCNTGSLATGAFGTALGAVRVLAERGRVDQVLVGETRPLLQGARLTTWELRRAGIACRLIVDSAAAWLMASGRVDCVVVGADRIAANGDVANKIGTYALAVAARQHRIPFVVVAPESTVDREVATGRQISIEERGSAEVTHFGGIGVAPEGTETVNPAFDVTPAELISSVVTERGELFPSLNGQAHGSSRPGPIQSAEVAAMAANLYQRGWLPGTAGNLSVRIDDRALITASGLAKGELDPTDMVMIRLADSAPVYAGAPRPSAESAIHTAIYRTVGSGAVVHAHSPYATAVSIRFGQPDQLSSVQFGHHEMLKAFKLADPSEVTVPVFANWPDVGKIGTDVEWYLREHADAPPVLLIAGHGVTAWGADLGEARNRLECLETLCQLVIITGRLDTWVPSPGHAGLTN